MLQASVKRVSGRYGAARRQPNAARSALPLMAAVTTTLSSLLVSTSAQAANNVWTGAVSANFADQNWTANGGNISSGDVAIFTATDPSGPNLNDNLSAGFLLGGITFNSGSPAYNISGNSFNLSGNIVNSATTSQTIQDAFTTTVASEVFNASSGNLILTGNINSLSTLTAGVGITSGSGKTVTLGGTDTFNGSGGNSLVIGNGASSSTTVLSTGQISVYGGGANLIVDNGATLNVSAGKMTLYGATAIGVAGGTANMLVSGGTVEQATGTFTLGYASSGSSGILTIGGSGKVVIDSGAAFKFRQSGTPTGGTLNLNSGGELDMAAGFTVGSSGAANIANFNGGTLKLTSNVTSLGVSGISYNIGNGGLVLDLNGFNTTMSQPLNASSGSTGGLTLLSSNGNSNAIGTLTLTGADNYTGLTTISNGTLNAGNNAALGNSTAATAGLLLSPASGSAATVNFNTPSPAIASLASSGTGTSMVVLGNTAAGSATSLSFGANGVSTAFGGSISDGAPSNANAIGSIVKLGSGTQTFSGVNTYTGTTTVSAGTLNVTGSLGNTSVNVATGAILTGAGSTASTGLISGSVTVNAGGTLAVSGVAGQELTIGTLTMNGQSNLSATVNAGAIEPIVVGTFNTPAGTLNLGTGLVDVSLSGITANGTYTLIEFGSQTGSGQFSFNSSSLVTSETLGRTTYTLADNSNSLVLTRSGSAIVPTVAYFNAAVSTVWNDASNPNKVNFSTNQTGTADAGNVPAAVTDVILTASNLAGTAVTSTLGGNTVINSLTVNSFASSNVLGNDGSTLTINAAADSNTASDGSYTGNAAGNGINITSGSGPFTINAPVILGGTGTSQTWTNASASTFNIAGGVSGNVGAQVLTLANTGAGNTIVSAPISNGGAVLGVTINNSGAGLTIFTAANTYSAVTTIAAGVLQLGDGTTGHDGSIASASIVDNGTLVYNISGTSSFAGAISGTGAVTKTGPGTVTLSGTDGYAGATTVSQGVLIVAADSALGGGSSSGLILNPAAGNSAQVNFTSATPSIGSLASSSAGSASITLGNTSSNTATVLTIGANNTSTTFSGTISDGTGSTSSAVGGITKVGSGTLTLSNSSTYTGNTTMNGGTLVMGNPNALGNASSNAILVFTGGTLDVATSGNDGLYTFQNNAGQTGTILSDVPAPSAGINHTFGKINLSYNAVLNVAAGSNVSSGIPSITFNTLNLLSNANSTTTLVPTTAALIIGNVTNSLGTAGYRILDLDGTNFYNAITGTIANGTGTTGISKTNTGIWTLSGTNTYTYGTNISNGILAMGSLQAFGNPSTGTATVNVTGSGEIGIPSDSYIADGAFNLSNYAVNYSSGVGIAFMNYNSSLSFTGIPTVRLGALPGTASSLSGNVSGATLLTYTGPGTLSTSGNLSTTTLSVTSGSLIQSTGAVTAASLGITGQSAYNLAGGTMNLSGTSFNVGQASGDNASLIISGGTLNDTAKGSLFIVNSGAANTNGSVILSGTATFNAPAATLVLGQYGSTTSATNTSTATLTLSGSSSLTVGAVLLGGANAVSYTNGVINLNGGTITAGSITRGNTNVAPSATSIVLNANGGTVQATTANANYFNGINVNLAGGGLTFNTSAYAVRITNNMSGAGSLTEVGSGVLTLSGSNSYLGNTNVASGTLTLASTTALPASTNLYLGTNTSNGLATLQPHGTGAVMPVKFNSLNIIGSASTFDVADNAAIIHTGSIASLTSELSQGYANGTWQGSSGIISSVAAADPAHLTALGSIINDTYANTGNASGTALYTALDGTATSAEDLLVKYTYYGDANLSGTVDGSDYTLIDNGYLNGLTGWYNGDFNYDGVIDGSDYTLIDNAFNTQGASLAAQISSPTAQVAGTSPVPEPASFGLMAMAGTLLMGRRRRHIGR